MPINEQPRKPQPAGRQPGSPMRQPPAGQARRAPQQNPQPRREQQTQPKPRHNKWFRAILMVLVTITGCMFLAFFILQSASDLFGLNQSDRQIEVSVPSNSTLQSITSLLYDKGIISQPFTFRLYATFKHISGGFVQGSYVLNSNMAYDELFIILLEGDTQREEARVTFIEGETLYEIARKLQDSKVCDADEFLDYMQTGDIDYEFMNQIPGNPLRFRRLEGYAFPDTYDFYVNQKVAEVADKFLSNFDKKITEEMRAQMREMNLSLDETIILASIIEKEAGDPVEKPMVSSVFHNRLAMPETFPQLQSDVTIHYVDNFIKPFLDIRDQAMYDAYNTYVCEGLPVGAICNPGLDSIEAALNPETSKFYFFVTDSEGTYYYAQNAQQHYNNVARASTVGEGKVHGTDTVNE